MKRKTAVREPASTTLSDEVIRNLVDGRAAAGTPLIEAGEQIHKSYVIVWRAEKGYGGLSNEDVLTLLTFYAKRACERAERIQRALESLS